MLIRDGKNYTSAIQGMASSINLLGGLLVWLETGSNELSPPKCLGAASEVRLAGPDSVLGRTCGKTYNISPLKQLSSIFTWNGILMKSILTNMTLSRLQGRVAIVTGASSGLGRNIALTFAANGAHVVCADLRPEGRLAPKDEKPTHEVINANGGKSIFVITDVADSTSVQALIQSSVDTFGRLDIMVNNAGIADEAYDPVPIYQATEERFDRTFQVNARGVFLGSKFAGIQMMKQSQIQHRDRGWILNIASALAVTGLTGTPCYAASKGAVLSMTRAIAMDFAPHLIHCNCIMPGFMDTKMIAGMVGDPNLRERLKNAHPFGRLGQPNDVANTALFLCSDDAKGVNAVGSGPQKNIYLIDIQTLGHCAFTTPGKSGKTLKDILESTDIPKVFFDVRNDSDALHYHFNIALQGVKDVQLMENASRRYGSKRLLNGLARCIEIDAVGDSLTKTKWKSTKTTGDRLFNPTMGGSYEVFNARPLAEDIKAYCVGDVQYLPHLEDLYWGKLTTAWREKVADATIRRVLESQMGNYQPFGKDRALGPWQDDQTSVRKVWDQDAMESFFDDFEGGCEGDFEDDYFGDWLDDGEDNDFEDWTRAPWQGPPS
ncbi:uncharacterized protein PV07_00197 [Cladophialophora immunda]|uniref:3'-5' exonuclease domain-containing protein n=1 Tax=Cladophialophora immunda TaxID=569365 RepID=A0A0D2CTT0_9EURO|nr:uncharacterized protein PV07_00197 [Cladophialophora immunda]KIW33340.1 hypothetical protein PV07_00197 [Cladophialophora immunda]